MKAFTITPQDFINGKPYKNKKPMDTRKTSIEKQKSRRLNFEQWVEEFDPTPNIVAKDAPYDGLMWETYGEELNNVEYIANKLPQNVWTLLDEGDDHPVIVEGMRLVNRLGYFMTSEPFDEDTEYTVRTDI